MRGTSDFDDLAAYRRLPTAARVTIYTDSKNCYQTLVDWAARWEADGWVRGGGKEVKNLDLVREAWELAQARPEVEIRWTARSSAAPTAEPTAT